MLSKKVYLLSYKIERKIRMFKLNPVAAKWQERCKKNGYRFAEIKTTRAFYDRVAIIGKSRADQILIIEYIKGSSEKRNPKKSYSIQTEKINRNSIVSIRYYVN